MKRHYFMEKIPVLLTALMFLWGMPAVWAADMDNPVETSVRVSVCPGTAELGQALFLNAEIRAQSLAVVESGRVDFYLIDDDSDTERLVGVAAVQESVAKSSLKPGSSFYPARAGTYTLIARYRAAEDGYSGSETRIVLSMTDSSAGPAGLITGAALADEGSVLLAAGMLLVLVLLIILWHWFIRQDKLCAR